MYVLTIKTPDFFDATIVWKGNQFLNGSLFSSFTEPKNLDIT
jgi:hypothetical protein